MSTTPAPAGRRSVRPPAAPPPRLAVVPPRPAQAPRVPFVALVVAVLTVGLVGLLLLNTSLQRRTFVVTDLRTKAAHLALREQNLQMQVSRLESPERLAAVAAAAGMVRNDSPAFLSLATGKVIGVAKPGQRAHSVTLYGGHTGRSASKVIALPAGSHNSGTSGPQHQASTSRRARGHPARGTSAPQKPSHSAGRQSNRSHR